MSPNSPRENDEGAGDTLDEMMKTREGRDRLADMMERGETIPGLPELTAEEEKVFDSRFDDGFLQQAFQGEFMLDTPLSPEDERELQTTTDPRRRMLLTLRKKNTKKK
jgi:hypothetical protein